MQEYSGFASVYDMFMDNVPYDKWAKYLHGLLKENGIKSGLVLDLGCGTGSFTRRLRDMGYDMIGVDISQEMLQIAMEKEVNAEPGKNAEMEVCAGQETDVEKSEAGNKAVAEVIEKAESGNAEEQQGEILYLNQDMREFELYGSVAAIVSICDSMNYITEEDDLLKVFRLAENYLDPNGMFIFDMNTEHYYKHVLGEQTICENRDEGSFIWDNYYDEESMINEFDMTIYARMPVNKGNEADRAAGKGRKNKSTEAASNGDSEVFARFEEVHEQRAYKLATVRKLLKKAGFGEIRTYAACTHDKPTSGTERVYFVAKRIRQQSPED